MPLNGLLVLVRSIYKGSISEISWMKNGKGGQMRDILGDGPQKEDSLLASSKL